MEDTELSWKIMKTVSCQGRLWLVREDCEDCELSGKPISCWEDWVVREDYELLGKTMSCQGSLWVVREAYQLSGRLSCQGRLWVVKEDYELLGKTKLSGKSMTCQGRLWVVREDWISGKLTFCSITFHGRQNVAFFSQRLNLEKQLVHACVHVCAVSYTHLTLPTRSTV